jgi:outer membrane biosynthesis protein TonB
MRADWLRLQDRRRAAVSWGLTVALYSVAFGAALIIGGAEVHELADTVGPVMVRLGRPDGSESPLASSILTSPSAKIPAAIPSAAATAPPATTAATTQSAKAPSTAVAVPPKAAALAPPAQPQKATQPEKAAPSKPVPSAPSAPAAPGPAATASPPASPSASASSPAGTASSGAAAGATAEVGPVIAKGSEAGNSYSASVGGSSGQVARSLYIPIYRYMPLPMYVDERVAAKVLDPASSSFTPLAERTKLLKDNYVKDADAWRLKDPLPLSRREALWTILEEAGYVVSRADYKAGKVLSPVVLVFTVTPGVGFANPTLTDVRITQSSGYSDIDEAVLYGFKQAVFSSSAKTPTTGKFTYRFDR